MIILLMLTVPAIVLAGISEMRWRKYCRGATPPKFQYHISDVLISTLWLGLIAMSIRSMIENSEMSFYFTLLFGGSAAIGLLAGKCWELTSSQKHRSSAAYLSLGVISGLMLGGISGYGFMIVLYPPVC